jgi:hypothetical protein
VLYAAVGPGAAGEPKLSQICYPYVIALGEAAGAAGARAAAVGPGAAGKTKSVWPAWTQTCFIVQQVLSKPQPTCHIVILLLHMLVLFAPSGVAAA